MNTSSQSGSDERGGGGLNRMIAEEGTLHILSFKTGSAAQYQEFMATNQSVSVGIEAKCDAIPTQLSHCSAGLINFDYQAFYRQYIGWTVRDYQARDSVGYTRLHDWLERREEEYRSGVRIDVALPSPTPAQRTLGANTLIDVLAQARTAMLRNQADFRTLRLTELPHLPMRSFIMKRLALRNAELAPLADLGTRNVYRQACLQFLLPTRAFSHLLSDTGSIGDYAHTPLDSDGANHVYPAKPLVEGIV